MRLIDADALPVTFDGHIVSVWKCDLNAAPTIDAAPVVHGEWKVWSDDRNAYDCSVCGTTFVLYEGTPTDNDWNYCPNCGARMDGGA